jgi:transposase
MIEVCPDITLNEMVARLEAERSIRIGRSALSDWLRGHAWTFKKVRTCIDAAGGAYSLEWPCNGS